MKLLAIDTAAGPCAACVFDTASGEIPGREVRDIGKGHAEHLMRVIDAAMRQAATGFTELGAIAVSVGPGSFTGVRVGVSAARGFALALRVPAIGVTTLEAIAADTRAIFGQRPVLSALDAGRGEIHAAVYDRFATLCYGPSVIAMEEAVGLAETHSAVLAGSAAPIIAAAKAGFEVGPVGATANIGTYARLAAAKGDGGERPRPVYLRQADARPQAGFVLPRQGK
jgi:tRNA threonylcarbamoyl adenosine modification protein YeaZ